ncbi:DoxX family protein [Leptospira ilyithenensis]|uniref:DoxX family protein n=2 Tax=Leptospira ilyithenensis TaxID=2484901 RepID=A0A4R9LQ17_9LEPT|nr:DoxX family protein [Leptospira ilyithenensis]
MLFSASGYFANPQVAKGFKHLGFPDYFRVELAIAKIFGAIVLVIPQISGRIKEWAYAGPGITFISAANAHFQSSDPIIAN